MPPKALFTREEIIHAALCIVKEGGMPGLTARSLAARLGCSVKPIFGMFRNMEEVQREVLSAAHKIYERYLQEGMAGGKYPPYKASGMAYIQFAKEEKELFKLLFMRDRSKEKIEENREEVKPLLNIIMKNTGLGEEDAYMLHLEMWIYVHGIATMAATSYLDWDTELISKMLTDGYLGFVEHYRREGQRNGSD